MLFTSYTFIAFVLITVLLFYLIPKRFQRILLLAANGVFYACSGWTNLIYITVTAVSTWWCAKRIGAVADEQEAYLKEHKAELSKDERKNYKAGRKKVQWRWLLLCLILNFGILAVLKYTNFTISNINSVLALFRQGTISFVDIALPMGISFYTFQTMGYILDVYRSKCEPEKNLLRLALFVSFFPQLIQGPISRYHELAPSLYEKKEFRARKFFSGLERVLWGFFKKLVVADRLLPAVKVIIDSPDDYKGVYVFVGMILYATELYADFTGGIDITIGIAEMFGIDVTENFIRPYFSKNIAEYWRRWHITMGTWFKDYIFYPASVWPPVLHFSKKLRNKLGDGIGKRFPVYLATILAWFVTGIWHGASWNFIVWGLLNCAVILISQELSPLYARFHARTGIGRTTGYRIFQMVRTFLLMSSLRILDCYRSVGLSFRMFGSMFTTFNLPELFQGGLSNLTLTIPEAVVVAGSILLMLAVSLCQRKESVRAQIASRGPVLECAVYIVLFLVTLVFGAYGVGYDSSQFIYNQF